MQVHASHNVPESRVEEDSMIEKEEAVTRKRYY
jgi:hypothetical protein